MGKYTATTHGSGSHWKWERADSRLLDAFSGNGRHPADELWDKMVPYFPWDWDSYESMLEWSTVWGVGGVFKNRADQLEYEENQRYMDDLAKNTGFDIRDSKYPIRAGVYRGYVSEFGAQIKATESILALYGGSKLMKW